MARLGITLILFITVFAMMREISVTWRAELPSLPVKAAKKSAAVEKVPDLQGLQPSPPALMPDLKPGYLFNAERLIVSEADKKAEEPQFSGNDLGVDADVAQLTYSGSIIGDTFSTALVSFPPGKKNTGRRGSKKRKKRTVKSSGLETAKLKVGDVLSGYQVAEILPDKLTLKKGDEVLEKFLYDSNKKRVAPKRKAKAPSTPRRPAPASANAPNPASTRTTRRGSTAQKAVRPPVPVPRKPNRRVVVSRKPPPKPDTSRVSRRGRTATPSTPPMPTLNR